MNWTGHSHSRRPQNRDEALTIRMATPGDTDALAALADLDSTRPHKSEQVLVAEVGGHLRAALSLDERHAVADPFHHTAALVAMLAERAQQLDPPARRRPSRGRRVFVRAPRPAPVPRA